MISDHSPPPLSSIADAFRAARGVVAANASGEREDQSEYGALINPLQKSSCEY